MTRARDLCSKADEKGRVADAVSCCVRLVCLYVVEGGVHVCMLVCEVCTCVNMSSEVRLCVHMSSEVCTCVNLSSEVCKYVE